VDTWWQTETGAIVMSPLPVSRRPSRAVAPKALPGFSVDLLDTDGQKPISVGGGLLAITSRGVHAAHDLGDDARYVQTYFTKWARAPTSISQATAPKRDETHTLDPRPRG